MTWGLPSVLPWCLPDNTTFLFSDSSQILAVMTGKPLMLHPQLQVPRTEPSIVIFDLGRTKVDIKYKKSINIHGSISGTVMSVLGMSWPPLTQSCCRHGGGFPSVSQTIISFHIPAVYSPVFCQRVFGLGISVFFHPATLLARKKFSKLAQPQGFSFMVSIWLAPNWKWTGTTP